VGTAPVARTFDAALVAASVRAAAERLAGSAGAPALLERSLVTPACGTALLTDEQARTVHARARDVAALLGRTG
jgi:hypothetical protein